MTVKINPRLRLAELWPDDLGIHINAQGADPGIDKKTGVFGVIVAHVNVAKANGERFFGFYSSPDMIVMV